MPTLEVNKCCKEYLLSVLPDKVDKEKEFLTNKGEMWEFKPSWNQCLAEIKKKAGI